MALNLYYVVISIYGWIIWVKGKNPDKPLLITRINKKFVLYLSFAGITLFFALLLLLKKYTDSPIPYVDAFTTAGSIIATWMLARKMLEHWILWIVIDAVSMGLYYYRGLYITIILFFVYTVISVAGFFKWRQEFNRLKLSGSLETE